MTKKGSIFFCQNCGTSSTKWLGKCPSCNEWNTFVEEKTSKKDDYLTFASRDVFVIAACHLKRGGTLELIGKEIDDFRIKKNILMPS